MESYKNHSPRWAQYHQGYDPIYSASYDFGFVFVDEEEIDDNDEESFDIEEDDAMLLN